MRSGRKRATRVALALATCAASMVLSACAPGPSAGGVERPGVGAQLRFDAHDYAAVFEETKRALRDAGFELERVDPAAGLIQTAPSADAAGSSLAGLARTELRSATATFHREGDTGTVRLVVVVHLVQRPTRDLDATSVQIRGNHRDPLLAERGLAPGFILADSRDDAAAATVLSGIESDGRARGAR